MAIEEQTSSEPTAPAHDARARPRDVAWQQWLAYLLMGLGGWIVAQAWLDPRYYPLAWPGMMLMFAFTIDQTPRTAFRRALVFGTVGILTAFSWVPEVISQTLELSYVTSVSLFLVFAVWDGFQFGLTCYFARRASRWSRDWVILYPVFWVAFEYVWPRIFPWRMGHSQLAWTSLIQFAEFTGVYGVSFLVIWVTAIGGVLLRQLVWKEADHATRRRIPRLEIGLALTACVAALGFGTWRIGNIEAIAAGNEPVRVALVQANVFEADAHATLQRLSADIAVNVDLVCWPETSVGVYSEALRDFRSEESLRTHSRTEDAVLRPWATPGCALLCAGKSYAPDVPDKGPYYVTAFLIDAEENILGSYHKRTLLPLGEYVPGEQWLPQLAELALLDKRISKGTSAQLLELPGKAKIGTLICYEDMVAQNARQSTREGAELLVALINGAAFGETLAMPQHQQLAFYRAIENRRYLLRCSSTGTTSVISPVGKVVAQLPPHTATALAATVYPMNTMTVYTRLGDVFSYGCIAVAVLTMVLCWRTAR